METQNLINPEKFDRIPIEILEPFVEAANFVFSNLTYSPWSPNQIDQKWRKRSVRQILRDGDVNYLYPCVDTAGIATYYLGSHGLFPRFKVLTDGNTIKPFQKGVREHLHLDSLTELNHQGTLFGLDIGSGDLTITTDINQKDSDGQKVYSTSRDEVWHRTGLISVNGKKLVEQSNDPLLGFLYSLDNQVPKRSLDISSRDFNTTYQLPDKESFLKRNSKEYNKEELKDYNHRWTNEFNDYLNARTNGEFPRLIPIKYQ